MLSAWFDDDDDDACGISTFYKFSLFYFDMLFYK